jgi:predicted GNAT superfamily acetyltransferase
VGAALVRAAEDWAGARGYLELASDAELDNFDSQRAHASLGFVEVGRAVLFVKALST